MKLRLKPSTWTLSICMIVMTFVSINLKWNGEDWRTVIASDSKGYYSYLPAMFIYDDPNYGFFDSMEREKYYNENTYTDYRSIAEGKIINKYYIGTAAAELPFFLTGHLIAKGSSWDADGYSKPYMMMLCVSALFYLLIGTLFVQKTLRRYGVDERSISWITVAGIFGTNLFYYAVVEAGTSHVYSFAFVSMLVYYFHCWVHEKRTKQLLILAFLLGMIVIIRPVNALVVLALPFIAGGWKSFLESVLAILQKKWIALLSVGIFVLVLMIQLGYYKLATGHWFVYSYREEGFDFTDPHIFDILFSFRKGLFLYTPIYLLAFIGLIALWKRKDRFPVFSWLIFFFVLTYILSSWWMWYYGGSFSSRVYVDYLPFFLLLLGIGLNQWRKQWPGWTLRIVTVLLIVLCQIQMYQYRYGQIHYSDTTKEQYWNNFLRIDKLT
ncbi:MAG: hypothetical protein NXI10_16995 [bacterium]|nr:hypothetical protein [bacterium]